jgi:hypothetical protein
MAHVNNEYSGNSHELRCCHIIRMELLKSHVPIFETTAYMALIDTSQPFCAMPRSYGRLQIT